MRCESNRGPRHGWWALLAIAAILGPGVASAQGVTVALSPTIQNVAPGAMLDVELQVVVAGHPFNGFDAVVTYDPAALTFMQAVPLANQQGCLMTGACSAACGNTFHIFTPSSGSLSITDILLCNQIELTGPGQIYKLHFQASNTPQITAVRFSNCVFYDAGFYVTPVTTSDAEIGIGMVAGVGGGGTSAGGLRVGAEPNPARNEVTLAIDAGAPGRQDLAVYDVTGRTVRRLSSGWFASGSRRVHWDGRNDAGHGVSPGTYLVIVRDGVRTAHARVTLLR
jgi:hypothetical protein